MKIDRNKQTVKKALLDLFEYGLCCLAANNQVIETEEFSCELSNKHTALARVGNRYGKQRAIWLWNVLLPTIYSIPIVVPTGTADEFGA